MRKLAPAALLATCFLIFSGLLATPAMADDEDDDDSTSVVVPKPKPTSETHIDIQDEDSDDEAAEEAQHKELKEKYGTSGKFLLPPLVIRPKHDLAPLSTEGSVKIGSLGTGSSGGDGTGGVAGASLGGFIAINPASALSGFKGDADAKSVNPERNVPIDLATFNFDAKTPIVAFFDAAKIGLYAMGLGVVALSITVGYRVIRHK